MTRFPQQRFVIPSTLVLAVLAALTGCGKSTDQPAQAAGMQAMPVAVTTLQSQPVEDAAEYVSALKSRNTSSVSPQVEGIITRIFVKSGDHVRAGQPLMQIDPLKQQATTQSQEAALKAQQANTVYAQQELERTQKLFEAGVVSKHDLDQAQSLYDADVAQVNSLRAQLREQAVQLKYYQVTSPTVGIVGDIPVHVGDRVLTTTMLTTVDQPGSLEAYVYVPVERSADLGMGRKVEVLGDDGSTLGAGQITFIAPTVDSQTQTILVKAEVPNPKDILKNDETVRARVIFGQHPGVTIPVLAVTRINGQPFVFVAEAGEHGSVARQREVKLGVIEGNNYVVLSGLKPGDKLITSNLTMMADGVPIQPMG